MKCFGSRDSIAFEVGALASGECDILVWVKNAQFWASEDGLPIKVDPVSFLYHMSIYWPYIFYSQSFPNYEQIIYNNNGPERYIKDALVEYTYDDTLQSEKNEEELLVFDRIHNMALWNDESSLPSLYLFKAGNEMLVAHDDNVTYFDISSIEDIFEHLGHYLCNEIANKDSDNHAIQAWKEKNNLDDDEIVAIKTGITKDTYPESYKILEKDLNAYRGSERMPETSYSIAARLSRELINDRDLFDLLSSLREIKENVPIGAISKNLLSLSNELMCILNTATVTRVWEEGYILAQKIRKTLVCANDYFFDIRNILNDLEIIVQQRELPNAIYALALWEKPEEQPLIVTNSFHAKARYNDTGMRANLAHEFCHILIDREKRLPITDVFFGGQNTPMEQRARAFAAELLCPRNLAIALAQELGNASLAELAAKFRVSKNLIALQLEHSGSLEALHDPLQAEVIALISDAKSRLSSFDS